MQHRTKHLAQSSVALSIGVIFAITAATSAQTPPQYRAKLITPGLSAVGASAMNNAGSVVGTSTTGSGAWVSHNGEPAILLPVPQGFQYAAADDIADTGVIVGSVSNTGYPGFGKAAAWFPNASGGYDITVFPTLPGHVSSGATGVNNVGDIIGSSHNGMYSYPVLFSAMGGGGPLDLTSTGIFKPAAINDNRVLVDQSFISKTLDLNTMQVQSLGLPVGSYLASTGTAINNNGQVSGVVILTTSTNCDRQAARYSPDSGWQVLSMCGSGNGAYDINNLGDVVMRLNLYPYVNFAGSGGGTFRIEDLIVNDVGHWYVINGYGITINDSRQMAVPATNSVTGEGGMILLTPILVEGDVTGDGLVNVSDLLSVVNAWGACSIPCPADFNNDGVVNLLDLLQVIEHWD